MIRGVARTAGEQRVHVLGRNFPRRTVIDFALFELFCGQNHNILLIPERFVASQAIQQIDIRVEHAFQISTAPIGAAGGSGQMAWAHSGPYEALGA